MVTVHSLKLWKTRGRDSKLAQIAKTILKYQPPTAQVKVTLGIIRLNQKFCTLMPYICRQISKLGLKFEPLRIINGK